MRWPFLENAIPGLWLAFALYWVFAALRQRSAKQKDSLFSRAVSMVLLVLAFVVLFNEKDRIPAVWIVLGLYVAYALLRMKRAKQRESLLTRSPHVAAMILAFALLFERRVSFGALDGRFVPESQTLAWAGIFLTACGIALAIWARYHLGANWSAAITIHSSHALVRTGPYARLRHPIYSGMLLAVAGTALAQGQWRGLVALGIILVAWSIKAKKEEAWLRSEFGQEFEDYARLTGFLMPRLTQRPAAQ